MDNEEQKIVDKWSEQNKNIVDQVYEKHDLHSNTYRVAIYDAMNKVRVQEKLIHQLFIGKVSEVIGMDKTVQLLMDSNEVFQKAPMEKNQSSQE